MILTIVWHVLKNAQHNYYNSKSNPASDTMPINITCDSITQNYTETSYRIVWNDEKFISILQPLLAMIQHKLKGNYLYAEGT